MRSSKAPSARSSAKLAKRLPWRDILDVLALGAWSAMLFRYWVTGKILLLLHPDYTWLSHLAAIVLLLLVLFTLYKIRVDKVWVARSNQPVTQAASDARKESGHMTLLPSNLSSAVLLGVAIFGLIYTPRAFESETAMQRGISETLTLTRAQPRRFVRAVASEKRTIIDWIRLVNVYPEPDAYEDEPVEVTGFVIHPEGWSADYLMISRFVLTCCAADAYPVGIPVVLNGSGSSSGELGGRELYPVDGWLKITGKMTTRTLDDRRQVAIIPTQITPIEEPKNPYEY